MKILITGCKGQVGFELQRSLSVLGEVVAVDRSRCDLANPESIRAVMREERPDVVVNAAAYTAVDKAEQELDMAMQVNGIGPGILAEEAQALNALLVHYSTDYVFDGLQQAPYDEDAAVAPASAYGRSKLAGEDAIREVDGRYVILRTSWVYGVHGNNFLKTMLRLMRERDALRVVGDQVGAPTSAALIADVTAHIVAQYAAVASGEGIDAAIFDDAQGDADSEEDIDGLLDDESSEDFEVAFGNMFPYGTYHLAAQGETTWFDYAVHIARLARDAGVELKVQPDQIARITTEDYPLPARRPAFSRLDTSKLRETFGLVLPKWEDGVRQVMTVVVG